MISLRYCRRRAGLTQRELAERSGVPQSSIARIESGKLRPRIDTLTRLIEACGMELQASPRRGDGIDRSSIRQILEISPAARLRLAAAEAQNLARLDHATRAR
jgi:transcriptional regulator with XRE-family HTH domain